MNSFRDSLSHLARLAVALVLFSLLAVAAFAQEHGTGARQATSSSPLVPLRGVTLQFGQVKGQLLSTAPQAPLQFCRQADGEDRNGDGAVARHVVPPVPEGPFVPSNTNPAVPTFRGPEVKQRPGAQANTDSITVKTVTNLNSSAHGNATSAIMEPSTASNGNVVMYTGNWFAALSTNGGTSFAYINPYTLFPASDGGFCCDQVLQYIPSIDRFVWILQYVANGSSENRERIATASSAQAAAGQWSFVDITSASLGLTNQELDFPALGASDNNLYLTSNVFNASGQFTRCICIRIALSDIADGGGATFNGFSLVDAGSLRPSQNAGSRMYLTAHNNTSSLRVIHWDDANANPISHNVTIPSWSSGSYSSLTPGNYNWLGRVDSRVTAATVVGGELWCGWTSAAGGAHGYLQPFVDIVRIDAANFTYVSDDRTIQFASGAAAAYASLNTNSNGEVAITYAWGGGGTYVPNTALGFLTGGDRRHYSVTSGTHGPSGQGWGDFLTIGVDGANSKLFSASAYALVGGTTNAFAVPTYVRFGRASDTSGAVQSDIYEQDDSTGTAKTITVGQTQYRNIHAVGNPDYATFSVASTANLILATDGPTGDTVMTLYGPNNSASVLEQDDDDGNGLFSLINRTLTPGTYWVKIEDFNNNDTLPAYSLALTAGSPTLQVTAPNGGESYAVNSTQTVTWTSSNVSGNVKVEFSSDGGANYSTLLADTPNDGTQSWTVPNTPTTQGRLKVTALDNSASDASDANFTIPTPPAGIVVTYPNGGETLVAGTSQNITWTSSNVTGNVQLQFSNDGGSSWSAITDTTNDGSEAWAVPAVATSQGRIRVVALNNSASDASNANFTIVVPSLTVTAPNGGEAYLGGSSQTLTWSSSNVSGNVKLEFSNDGGANWSTLSANTANDGSEAWTVPTGATSQGRVRVSALDGSASDISNANFTVTQPTLTVTAPNGGEAYLAASVQTVTWTSSGVSGNVQIEFSSDGGNNWSTVTANTANDGSENWTLPAVGTTQGRIRVSALNASASDTSNSNFTVLLPSLTVTAPNGGESYAVNSSQTVTWTSSSVSGNVKLEFSSDGGANWTVLNASTANDGAESWTTPGTPTTQGRIRVSAVDGSAGDTSNGNFSLTYVGGILSAPASVNFGTVKVGKSKIAKVQIQNKSKSGNLIVSFVAPAAPYSVDGGTGPFTLAPKGKLTLSVRFVPTGTGLLNGTLRINSSDPVIPVKSITLKGKAN